MGVQEGMDPQRDSQIINTSINLDLEISHIISLSGIMT